jgi:hypothetical protein
VTDARCLCSHLEANHYRDRDGRVVCGTVVCGCAKYRPREEKR